MRVHAQCMFLTISPHSSGYLDNMKLFLGLFLMALSSVIYAETINMTCINQGINGQSSTVNLMVVSASPSSKGKVYSNDKDLDSSRQVVSNVKISPTIISYELLFTADPTSINGRQYSGGSIHQSIEINRTSGHLVTTEIVKGDFPLGELVGYGVHVRNGECGPRRSNKF